MNFTRSSRCYFKRLSCSNGCAALRGKIKTGICRKENCKFYKTAEQVLLDRFKSATHIEMTPEQTEAFVEWFYWMYTEEIAHFYRDLAVTFKVRYGWINADQAAFIRAFNSIHTSYYDHKLTLPEYLFAIEDKAAEEENEEEEGDNEEC